MLFKLLRIPLAITVLSLVAALVLGGPHILLIVAVLMALEVSLSFDNAVLNAKIVGTLNEFWQKLFLSVGTIIAVFGMRLVFPLVIISIAASISPIEAIKLALNAPDQYSVILKGAHSGIAAFGGTFLLLIYLGWVFESRKIKWLVPLEAFLSRIGKLESLSVTITLVALTIIAPVSGHPLIVLSAGVFGVISYLLINGLSELFQDKEDNVVTKSGRAAFFAFLYLEVLDASLSFDGVVGALAISNQILVISLGLGVGALYVRALTVYLVRKGTLKDYIYLEHGAHWAIGALAAMLIIGIKYELPEVVTGLVGVTFIITAFIQSWLTLRKEAKGSKRRTMHANKTAKTQ